MTAVTVQGADALSGVGQITLLYPDGSVSTQTFSGPPTASYTFSGLPDGQFVASVYDQAQNVIQQNFTTKALPLVVERRQDAVCKNGSFAFVKFREGSLLYRQAGRLSELT
jgi:hypothetical protein